MEPIIMDAELVGRMHGYVQWGAQIHLNRQEHRLHKDEVMAMLREKHGAGFDANKQLINELKQIIVRKQEPLHEQKVYVYHDIKETIGALKSNFKGMHAELFAEDAFFAAQRLHENVIAFTDIISRQARLVSALNPQTFDDIMPQIFYLYEREKAIEKEMSEYAHEFHKKSRHVLSHININYFERLRKLAEDRHDRQYCSDHHDIFVSAYLLNVGSRAVANVHGIDTTEANKNEELFLNNIAPSQ